MTRKKKRVRKLSDNELWELLTTSANFIELYERKRETVEDLRTRAPEKFKEEYARLASIQEEHFNCVGLLRLWLTGRLPLLLPEAAYSVMQRKAELEEEARQLFEPWELSSRQAERGKKKRGKGHALRRQVELICRHFDNYDSDFFFDLVNQDCNLDEVDSDVGIEEAPTAEDGAVLDELVHLRTLTDLEARVTLKFIENRNGRILYRLAPGAPVEGKTVHYFEKLLSTIRKAVGRLIRNRKK